MKKMKDLSVFVEAATKHAEATEQGNYKIANKNYDKIGKIIDYLKESNQINELLLMLDHEITDVNIWTAVNLLKNEGKYKY